MKIKHYDIYLNLIGSGVHRSRNRVHSVLQAYFLVVVFVVRCCCFIFLLLFFLLFFLLLLCFVCLCFCCFLFMFFMLDFPYNKVLTIGKCVKLRPAQHIVLRVFFSEVQTIRFLALQQKCMSDDTLNDMLYYCEIKLKRSLFIINSPIYNSFSRGKLP